jgi:hypothetical protein
MGLISQKHDIRTTTSNHHSSYRCCSGDSNIYQDSDRETLIMSPHRLKRAGIFAIAVGLGFLIVGAVVFTFSVTGGKPEKLGVVLMINGGILVTMGFTALVASKMI